MKYHFRLGRRVISNLSLSFCIYRIYQRLDECDENKICKLQCLKRIKCRLSELIKWRVHLNKPLIWKNLVNKLWYDFQIRMFVLPVFITFYYSLYYIDYIILYLYIYMIYYIYNKFYSNSLIEIEHLNQEIYIYNF